MYANPYSCIPLRQIAAKRRSSGDEYFHLPTYSGPDFRIKKPVCQLPTQGAWGASREDLGTVSASYRKPPFINRFMEKTLSLQNDLGMYLFIHAGNADENRGTNLGKSFWKLIEKRNICQRDPMA